MAEILEIPNPTCMFVAKSGERCTEKANEFTWNTSRQCFDWATCPKHKPFVRPYVEMHGKKRTSNESVLHAVIAARIDFRMTFTHRKWSPMMVNELADDIVETLFTQPNLTVVKYLVREKEEMARATT